MAGSFSKKQYAAIADRGIGNEFIERTIRNAGTVAFTKRKGVGETLKKLR